MYNVYRPPRFDYKDRAIANIMTRLQIQFIIFASALQIIEGRQFNSICSRSGPVWYLLHSPNIPTVYANFQVESPNSYSTKQRLRTQITMAQEIDPNKFSFPFLATKTLRRDPYPAILPSNPANSQKGKIIIITGGSSGIGAVSRLPLQSNFEQKLTPYRPQPGSGPAQEHRELLLLLEEKMLWAS